MQMPPLPPQWEPTRSSLQKYAQAITAHARAAADPDPRWRHVSLDPVVTDTGIAFVSAPVRLSADLSLVAELDANEHKVVLHVGDDTQEFDLRKGPSPRSIGDAMTRLVERHGEPIDVDTSRFSDTERQPYDSAHAEAWSANALWIVSTLGQVAERFGGETVGPHLWPHGFDIATEWFSAKVVDDDGSNAQIAAGFYPAGDAYFYVNPWPFDADWADKDLPESAQWHTDGWYGATLKAEALGSGDDDVAVIDLVSAVHAMVRPGLE